MAGQLAAAGVGPGEHVGILAEDRAVFCDAFYGLQHLGGIPVPLGLAGHPGSDAWSAVLRDRVERMRLVAIATDDDSATALRAVIPELRAVGVDGSRGNPVPPGPPSPVAFIQPSSGTTGAPKGIVISQAALLANLHSIREQWQVTEADSGLTWLPLFHDMGLIGTVINALWSGGTLYQWPTESFLRSPGRWVELLGELQVTFAIAPPFALELVARRFRRRGGEADLSSVHTMLVGAETIRPGVIEGFAEVFEPLGLPPDALCPTYGLAEATLTVTAKPRGTRFVTVKDGLHEWVSCGRPVPDVEIRLDPETSELLTRTPAAMTGYLDDPEATAAAFDGEWLRTGDVAQIVDGEVVIVGRLKEMINRNGQRVAASDFELAVQGTEGVLPDRVIAFGDVGPEGSASCSSPSRATERARRARWCSRSARAWPTRGYRRMSWSWSRPASSRARPVASFAAGRRGSCGSPARRAAAKRSSQARWRRFASRMNGECAIAQMTVAFTRFIGKRSGRTTSTNSTTRSPSVSFQTSCS